MYFKLKCIAPNMVLGRALFLFIPLATSNVTTWISREYKIKVLTQSEVEEVLHRRSCRCVEDAASRCQEADVEFHRHADHEENFISDHVLPQEKNAGIATIPLENSQ